MTKEELPLIACLEVVNRKHNTFIIPGSKVINCSDCEIPVYLSPSALDHFKNDYSQFKIICMQCLLNYKDIPISEKPLDSQIEERKKYGMDDIDYDDVRNAVKSMLEK